MENREQVYRFIVQELGDRRYRVIRLSEEALVGNYFWIVWNDETEEWEKVGLVMVSHPWIIALIEEALNAGHNEFVVLLVSSLLNFFYDVPSWNRAPEIWEKSQIIRITEHPEKVFWRVSPIVEKLGFKEGIPAFVV
jgi:hypothetical protein